MQPHSKPRPIGPTCIRRSLTVFALTLALLALVMILGALFVALRWLHDTPQGGS